MQWNNALTSNKSFSRMLQLVVASFFADLIKAARSCMSPLWITLWWSRVWRIHTTWIAWMLSHICRPNRGDGWIYSTLWASDLWSVVQRTDGPHLEQFYRPIEQSKVGSRVSGYSELSQTTLDAHGLISWLNIAMWCFEITFCWNKISAKHIC